MDEEMLMKKLDVLISNQICIKECLNEILKGLSEGYFAIMTM